MEDPDNRSFYWRIEGGPDAWDDWWDYERLRRLKFNPDGPFDYGVNN